jgi:hypothetical protein
MPLLSEDRKNEIARLFMQRRKNLYSESFSKSPYENLKHNLYRRGFSLGHTTPHFVREVAENLGISVFEATDFFKAVIEDLIETVSREVRKQGADCPVFIPTFLSSNLYFVYVLVYY